MGFGNEIKIEISLPVDEPETVKMLCQFLLEQCELVIEKERKENEERERKKKEYKPRARKVVINDDVSEVGDSDDESVESEQSDGLSGMFTEKDGKYTCKCSSVITRGGISKHLKTLKHRTFLETVVEEPVDVLKAEEAEDTVEIIVED